jgi:hypothetical protein
VTSVLGPAVVQSQAAPVEQIADAKSEATRERRAAKAVQMLSEGKAR